MVHFRKELRSALLEAGDPDIFCDGGALRPEHLPCLCITALKPSLIGLPLQNDQISQLAALCEQAPFGKGAQTVVDLSVRNSLQLDASEIQVAKEWEACIRKLASESAKKLGVHARVSAKLYKLILYPPGGFFKKHKDTEKEDAMFGTLVVQLPCAYDEGSLVVRYRGETETFDFSGKSGTAFYYAAFYTDCEHELVEIKGGYRLTLLYNLVQVSNNHVPKILQGQSALVEKVTTAADKWVGMNAPPERFSILLNHEYTRASLSFDHLKGGDRAMAALLRESGKFRLQLALVHLRQWIGGDETDADMTVKKVVNAIANLDHMEPEIKHDEADLLTGEFLFNTDQDSNCDKEETEVKWGNESPTVTRWYYKALLLVRPMEQRRDLQVDSSNFEDAITAVEEAIANGAKGSEKALLDLLFCASRNIKETSWALTDLLDLALRLESKMAVRLALSAMAHTSNEVFGRHEMLTKPPSRGCDSRQRADKLANVVQRFGWEEVGSLMTEIVEETPFATSRCHLIAHKLKEIGGFEEQAKQIVNTMIRSWMNDNATAYYFVDVVNLLVQFPECADVREEFKAFLKLFQSGAIYFAVKAAHPLCSPDETSAPLKEMYHCFLSTYVSEVTRTKIGNYGAGKAGEVLNFLLKYNSNVDDLVESMFEAVLATNSIEVMETVLSKVEDEKSQAEQVMTLVRAIFRKVKANKTSGYACMGKARLLCRFPSCADAIQKFRDLVHDSDSETVYYAIIGVSKSCRDGRAPASLMELYHDLLRTFVGEIDPENLKKRGKASQAGEVLNLMLSIKLNVPDLIKSLMDTVLTTDSGEIMRKVVLELKGKQIKTQQVTVLIAKTFKHLETDGIPSCHLKDVTLWLCRFPECVEAIDSFQVLAQKWEHDEIFIVISAASPKCIGENIPTSLRDMFRKLVIAFASGAPSYMLETKHVNITASVIQMLVKQEGSAEDLVKVVVDAVLATKSRSIIESVLSWLTAHKLKTHAQVSRIAQKLDDMDQEMTDAV